MKIYNLHPPCYCICMLDLYTNLLGTTTNGGVMDAALRQDVLTECYLDVQGLVYKAVQDHYRKYGGEWEELHGEANLLFVQAYDKYEEDKGKFPSWVYYFVSKNLLEKKRKEIYRNNRLHKVPDVVLEYLSTPRQNFILNEFVEELSLNAEEVIELLLDTPIDIKLAMQKNGKITPHKIKRALVEWLKDCGWGTQRILETFKEIKEALK